MVLDLVLNLSIFFILNFLVKKIVHTLAPKAKIMAPSLFSIDVPKTLGHH